MLEQSRKAAKQLNSSSYNLFCSFMLANLLSFKRDTKCSFFFSFTYFIVSMPMLSPNFVPFNSLSLLSCSLRPSSLRVLSTRVMSSSLDYSTSSPILSGTLSPVDTGRSLLDARYLYLCPKVDGVFLKGLSPPFHSIPQSPLTSCTLHHLFCLPYSHQYIFSTTHNIVNNTNVEFIS